MAAMVVLALFFLNRRGVTQLWPYLLLGIVLWIFVYRSGVHATLAGVLVGLLVPATVPQREQVEAVPVYAGDLVDDTTAEREHLAELAARAAVPTSDRLQRILHPWSAYLVVPLFGLANAGVVLDAQTLADAATSRVTIGVAVALVVAPVLKALTLSVKLPASSVLPDAIVGSDAVGSSPFNV